MNFLFEEVKVRFLNVSCMYMNLDSKEKIQTEVSKNFRSVAESHVQMILGTKLHLFNT